MTGEEEMTEMTEEDMLLHALSTTREGLFEAMSIAHELDVALHQPENEEDRDEILKDLQKAAGQIELYEAEERQILKLLEERGASPL